MFAVFILFVLCALTYVFASSCFIPCSNRRSVLHVFTHTLPTHDIPMYLYETRNNIFSWMNEFVQIEEHESILEVGDLVHMTIVDVFETDNNGRLLSYCPTFDNRDIRKTTLAHETLRKSSTKIMSQWSVLANSQAAARLNQGVNYAAKIGMEAAKSTYDSVKNSIDERMSSNSTGNTPVKQQQQQQQQFQQHKSLNTTTTKGPEQVGVLSFEDTVGGHSAMSGRTESDGSSDGDVPGPGAARRQMV